MKMKAMVLEDYDKMVVQEVEKPEVEDDGILLRVRACAICGSDLRIVHSGNNRVQMPRHYRP